MSKTYFNLSEGGAQILQAASRIYAAYVSSGRVPEGNEKEWMRRREHAMSFAKTIDDLDDTPRRPAVVATGAAIAASVPAGSTDAADPDDTAGHDDPTGSTDTTDLEATGDQNVDGGLDAGGSPDDTGIELSATTDEQTVSDDDVLAAIMDDQQDPQDKSAAFDPSAEMMDELPDADQDMSLDAKDDDPVTPKPTSADDGHPVAKTSAVANEDDLDIDDNVLAAFADTELDTDDEPSNPVASQAAAPAATNNSNDADESGEAIEFLSTLADELPPATNEPADMDDIMSALMDDAAEPVAAAKQAGTAIASGAANPDQDAPSESSKSAPPIAFDDAEEPIPVAENEGDADAETDAAVTADQDEQPVSKSSVKPDRPQYAELDEPTNPTEANLAATHLGDDLSFELVDEDIDMNKLIEDAITATEKKDDGKR